MKILYPATLLLSAPVLTSALKEIVRPDGNTCFCPASCYKESENKVLQNPPSIKVEHNVLTEEQCQAMLKGTLEEEFVETRSGYRFFTHLNDQQDELWDRICGHEDMPRDAEQIPISVVRTTSRDHRDRYADPSDPETFGTIIDEETVLLYLNDNPDAFFVYENQKIPLSCGTKLTFHGGYPHHTEVTSGDIKFLGPLTARSCSVVGDYSYGGQCETVTDLLTVCSCKECDDALPSPKPTQGCCDGFNRNQEECVYSFEYDVNPSSCPASMENDGDPHVKTWGGKWFDYHGECDLLLVDVPDFEPHKDLMVQVRTRIRHGYSYIESAAMRLGEDIVEVSSFGQYVLNGVNDADLTGATVAGYPIYHRTVGKKHHIFDVVVGPKENITFTTFKDLVGVKVTGGRVDHFGHTRGLQGSYNGTLFARDGLTVMSAEQDPNAIGQEWQVREDEPMLFQTVRAPQAPQEKCRLPTEGVAQKRRLGQGKVSVDEPEVACSGFTGEKKDNCIFDVLAVDDQDLVIVY